MNKAINIFLLVVLVVVMLTLAYISSFAMTYDSFMWYDTLNRSSLNPPKNVFSPIWSVLYFLMAVALWRVIIKPRKPICKIALSLFVIQLFLNFLWTYIFFYQRSPVLAFAELIILDMFVILTITVFAKIDKVAGYLMTPYLIWLILATYLNYYVVSYN